MNRCARGLGPPHFDSARPSGANDESEEAMRHLTKVANKNMHINANESPFVVKAAGKWYALSPSGRVVELEDPGTLHSSMRPIEVSGFSQIPDSTEIEEFFINRDQVFAVGRTSEMRNMGLYDYAGNSYIWWPSDNVIVVETDYDTMLNDVMKAQAARVEMLHGSGATIQVYPWAIQTIQHVRKGETLLTRRGSIGCLVKHPYEEVIETLSLWTGKN